MSKDIEWGIIHGAGDIVCMCDSCFDEERWPFEDKNIDYREAQAMLKRLGWTSCQVKGTWYDFCTEECRNDFIKQHG